MSPSLQTMGFFMSDINFCNTKEQLNHLGEVVTGKVNGSPTGADIDTSTLTYTGQVRKTLPALETEYEQSITNKEIEADAAIDAYRLLSKGPYATGITLEDKFQYITYNGESYFAANPPYTTTATTPDADGNLFVGNYATESSVDSKIKISQQVVDDIVVQYDIVDGSVIDSNTEAVTFLGSPTIYPFTTPNTYGSVSSIDIPNKTMSIDGNPVRLLKKKYFPNDEMTDIRLFFIKKNDVISEDFYSEIINYVSTASSELHSPINYQVTGGGTQDIPTGLTFSGSGKVTFDNFAFTTPMVKGASTTISTIVGTYEGGYWVDVVDGSVFSDGDYVLFENNKPKWNLNPQPSVTVDYKTLTLPEALESYLTEVRQIERVEGNRVYFNQPFTEKYDPATSTITLVDVREDITFDGVNFEFINLQYPNMYLTGAQKLQYINRCKFNMGMLFENCNDGYFENIQIDSYDASLSFHGSRRNSVIAPKISHRSGDAAILFYQGSMDNEVVGGSASMKEGSFASGVLIYDMSNRCSVKGFNAKGFQRCVDVRGYSRGVVANDNILSINYLRTNSRNFSICINAEFTSELTAKGNKCISSVIPNAAYNMIGLYCVGVSDSYIEDNDLDNCSMFCAPPGKFLGYSNFVEEGNESSYVCGNNLKSRIDIPSSFKQNVLNYASVIAPALVTDLNLSPAISSRYAIINNSPLTGWRMFNNNVSGFPAAKVEINANTDTFSSIVRGGSIDDCGCGLMIINAVGAPSEVTVPVHALNHDFENTYNAIVNQYHPGVVVDFNTFTNCHNIINYAAGSSDNEAWRGHAFSGTAFGANNTFKHYYNMFINQGTYNILNENVAKLPDGVVVRFDNNHTTPVDREWIFAGNSVPNEALPVTKIRRNVTEIQE